jgi:hypothetical protein
VLVFVRKGISLPPEKILHQGLSGGGRIGRYPLRIDFPEIPDMIPVNGRQTILLLKGVVECINILSGVGKHGGMKAAIQGRSFYLGPADPVVHIAIENLKNRLGSCGQPKNSR